MGEDIFTQNEHYELSWAGKAQARREIQKTNSATLTPDSVILSAAKNPAEQTAQHVFIEGENLEVLRVLQKSYFGRVKMIYIDPPYNTGNDSFVYPDDYTERLSDYKKRTGLADENGFINKQDLWRKNSKESGQYHSVWLSMMYPRLYLARNLLRDDGVIFISIDDNEAANLKLLCDEVFGEENFINSISVNMKNIAGASGGGEDKRLKKNIENLLIYAKNYEALAPFDNVYVYTPIGALVQKYRDDGISWKYTSALIHAGDKDFIGSTVDGDGNEIKIFLRSNSITKSVNQLMQEEKLSEENVYVKYAKKIFQTAMPQSSIRPRMMKKIQELGSLGDMYSIEYTPKTGRNKGVVYEQFYKGESFRLFAWLSDVSVEKDGVLYKKDLQGTYWDLASQTKNLTKEGDVPFPNGKKPVALINRLLKMQTDAQSIILDFFAGSGTTAQAVMELNLEDGGNRQCICVQMPEVLDETSEAFKAGYKTIADITRARINKVIAKLKAAKPMLTQDLTCANFTLTPSHFKVWQPDVAGEAAIMQQLELHQQAENPASLQQNMLTELLLKMGLGLAGVEAKANLITVVDTEIYAVSLLEGGLLWLCFNPYKTALKAEIVKAKPQQIVFLNSCFTGSNADEQLTNLELELQQHDIKLTVI